ncbi:MAG: fumarylacetoacetate hydrolase family protein [Cryobacterium sp.]|nr:fumarylacetoacetate hydrolase family protein [Cryobacterium sp.]
MVDAAGEPVVVVFGSEGASMATVGGRTFADLPDLLEAAGGHAGRIVAGAPIAAADAAKLLAPIARPRKIICVGKNYLEHVREFGGAAGPAHPDLFAKWDNALAGPFDTLPLPLESTSIDFEAELAVVIGRRSRRLTREQVTDAVFGFTAANDGSVRDFQNHTTQRTAGKAWDRLTPLGPVVVPAAHLGGVEPDVRITGLLNGEIMQDDRTTSLMFDIPSLLVYITTIMTLEPGDLVLTGTPSGVGGARDPKVFLRDGDSYEVRIEGIGSLVNRYETESF